ncbi:DUF739 domain-containing protein [Pseudoflavonifractor phocaeensis]|uniref:DUF739 domain-containing protein n=1 Tax=Pseudoflavonifractor phocaeensis TaxID=1870988 RepID=UPI00313DF5C8
MVDTDKLRGVIAERGLSQRRVAKHLGMTEKTFYTKMKKGVFDSDEMAEMITYLGIDNPYEIFFASLGAHCAPSEKRG